MNDVNNQEFNDGDAAGMIALVRSAPLNNMQHATAVQALLDRFAIWYEIQTAETDSTVAKIGSTK